jgi:Ni,Fe-hydrogenase III component G
MNHTELKKEIEQRWPGDARCDFDVAHSTCEVKCSRSAMPELCGRLFLEWNFSFAGLVVEENASEWQLRHCFYGEREAGWVHVLATAPLAEKTFPSIVKFVHAADWHEREAEDLFGLVFEGHPRLGDFILHDDAWQENVEPMRRHFDPRAAMVHRKPDVDWRPHRIVQETGAFVMPVGPKFSGVTESVHFLLETVGEDVIRSTPRLFYKWRAIEKLAEGKTADEVLLIAERFAATTAFAHGLAFCQAVEKICGANVPVRAKSLRVFLAELERLRQHAGAIQEICESTALVVANSQAGILEEDLLRISGQLTGHRYLFGLLALGGLLCDLPNDACAKALAQSQQTLKRLNELEKRLRVSSSFLDRLEEVGVVALRNATAYGLLGPIARASGRRLRAVAYFVRRSQTIGSHHGTSCCRAAKRRHPRILSVSSRRGAGLGRSAARRGVPLGATGRERTDCAPSDYPAVVRQLARFPSRRREIRVPGFSHHALHVRFVRGGKRPMK